jgi:hypothetical protein
MTKPFCPFTIARSKTSKKFLVFRAG